jgi:hypothetical protein
VSNESRERKKRSFSLGAKDIPWWAGLVGLVALLYVAAYSPSEMRPLPILLTVPAAGERDVPLDTAVQIQFEAGGFAQTFDTPAPPAKVTYLDGPQHGAVPVSGVTSEDDVLRIALGQPLQPGRHVQVAVTTRYGRDVVWTFYTASAPPGATVTP